MKNLLTTLSLGAVAAGSANAAEILVGDGSQGFVLNTSQTWTANNTYNLQGQVYLAPGVTLTIEPGTVIASDLGGSIAVPRGAQIFAEGTSDAPIIFTSKADVATWTNGDPKTGTWRASANEWGNLTIMGRAFISEDEIPSNTPTPSASNYADMEGLTPPAGFVIGRYGGGNDNDDSGTVAYVSFRYGGRVVGLGNELNGLSLGGIGRGTDLHHIEIMNNVDDGIEIWGGTVNLKYFSIWNIGDDSLDLDQGWRGKAQFGLIVQGYSLNAPQGSGVGDNAIEIDGAEDSDWQPVTTTTIYNTTIIGQPVSGDGLVAYRDGARLQLRNSLLMFCGENVVRFDNVDGDGGSGYGHNGTLSWADTWTTSFSQTSPVNAPANPAAFYTAQTSGNLNEITDSVFYANNASSAYNEANARGVFDAGNNNTVIPGTTPSGAPINSITFGPQVPTTGGLTMVPVIGLDPRPTGLAATSAAFAPTDGFFTPARYRGAFNPDESGTWLTGWTASDAFGFTSGDAIGSNFCDAQPTTLGLPAKIRAYGSTLVADNDLKLEASDVPPLEFGIFLVSRSQGFVPNLGGNTGDLCLGVGTLSRFQAPGQIKQASLQGVFSLDVDLNFIPQAAGFVPVMAGDTWNFQAWFRNTPTDANLSNGISISFQ